MLVASVPLTDSHRMEWILLLHNWNGGKGLMVKGGWGVRVAGVVDG